MLTAYCPSYVRDDDNNNNNHNHSNNINDDTVAGCQVVRGGPAPRALSSPSNIDAGEGEGS